MTQMNTVKGPREYLALDFGRFLTSSTLVPLPRIHPFYVTVTRKCLIGRILVILNEYRILAAELNVQVGCLKALSFVFEYVGSQSAYDVYHRRSIRGHQCSHSLLNYSSHSPFYSFCHPLPVPLSSCPSLPDTHLSFTPGRICLLPKLRIGVAPASMGMGGRRARCILRHNSRGYRRLVCHRVSSILHCFPLTMIGATRCTVPLSLYHLQWTCTACAQRCIVQRSPPSTRMLLLLTVFLRQVLTHTLTSVGGHPFTTPPKALRDNVLTPTVITKISLTSTSTTRPHVHPLS